MPADKCPKCCQSWKLCECDITEPDDPIHIPEPLKSESPDIRMPFGKYKGRFLSDIPAGYLDWALQIAQQPFLSVLEDHLLGRSDWHNLTESFDNSFSDGD